MLRYISRIIQYTTVLFSFIHTQEVPNEYYQNMLSKLYYDTGIGWKHLSHFGPIRFQEIRQIEKKEIPIESDSLVYETSIGIRVVNDSYAINGSVLIKYKKDYYCILYPRIVSNPNAFDRFSGISRPISRFGLRSGEVDLSGLGFENDWFLIQFGRGRQSWGAGNSIQLALGERSSSYDYGMLGFNIGNIRSRYFHGYLETIDNSNRYIVGKGLEFTNKNNFLFSISEIVIYSGKNRPLDIAYFNPMTSHLEIEMNDRQNQLGTDSGNAVWQLSSDILLHNRFRLSGNLVIDEFVIDKIQRDAGHNHFIGWSFKSVYTLKNKSKIIPGTIYIYVSWVNIGTNTFRHEKVSDEISGETTGYNNFVHRNRPLGWQLGSDCEELNFGINHFNKSLISNIKFGFYRVGSRSTIYDSYKPYDNYNNDKFPSGVINNTSYINYTMEWRWRKNIKIYNSLNWSFSNINKKEFILSIGFDFFNLISNI